MSRLGRSGHAGAAFLEVGRRVGRENFPGVQTGAEPGHHAGLTQAPGEGKPVAPSLSAFPVTPPQLLFIQLVRLLHGSAVIKPRAMSIQPRPKPLAGSRCSGTVHPLPAARSPAYPTVKLFFPLQPCHVVTSSLLLGMGSLLASRPHVSPSAPSSPL